MHVHVHIHVNYTCTVSGLKNESITAIFNATQIHIQVNDAWFFDLLNGFQVEDMFACLFFLVIFSFLETSLSVFPTQHTQTIGSKFQPLTTSSVALTSTVSVTPANSTCGHPEGGATSFEYDRLVFEDFFHSFMHALF